MEWNQQETQAAKPALSPAMRHVVVGMQRASTFFARHWLFFINGFFGLLVAGALLAPALMQVGLSGPARGLYAVYSFTCHQLPERSYFLFTPEGVITTYDEATVVQAGADNRSLLTRRQFIGSPEVGWKTGFSDRMFSMYGGAFLGGLIYWLFSRRRPMTPIPIPLMVLLALPMAIDGTSHLISEVTALGFRDTNAWAMPLFGSQPAGFYTGSAWGSLNSTLRLVTGLLFGIGTMLFAYPLIGYGFNDLATEAEKTLARNEARLRSSQ